MSVIFRPCVLIPCYNHGAMIASVLSRLAPFGLPCLVVDDGSDAVTRRELERLAAEQPQMTLVRLAQNAGKGAAVIRGLEECARTGYTHAVQVDADGQHAIEDIPKLLALAERPGRVLGREQLLQLSRGEPSDSVDRAVDLAISRLRRKLEQARAGVGIRMLRGLGYRLEAGGD